MPMATQLLLVACAVCFALLAPRHRQWTLWGSALALPALTFLWLLVGSPLPLLAAALLLALGSVLALALSRALPRLFVFLLLAGALVNAGPPLVGATALWLYGASLVLLVVALVHERPDLALRLACSLLGARLLLLALPAPGGAPRAWLWGFTAGLLLLGELAARSQPDRFRVLRTAPEPLPWARVRRLLGAVFAAVFLGLSALAFLAPVLPAPAQPASAARLSRASAQLPQGGLVWPLPSEALLWGPEANSDVFPRIDNLDARWLTGLPLRGLYLLPHTSLLGAFSTHSRLVAQRLLKDADELDKLRFAALATVASVREVLPLIVPGTPERDLAAAVSAAFLRHGCDSDSFPPVVSSGPAASAPHGDGNRGVLQAGTLLVLDVGCYKDHYASDFTRTFPVGGSFTPQQRKDVEAVLAAQAAALASCKAGARVSGSGEPPSLGKRAADELERRGLPGSYGHGLSHPVGLFAHDVDDHKPLRAGMVITLEPGRYEKGAFGIRIEDTVLVRDADCTALTAGLPGDPASIEALLASVRTAPAR